MTPHERKELEAMADRARRRGELNEAVALYAEIADEYPLDDLLQAKLKSLEDSLEPTEELTIFTATALEDDQREAQPLVEAERFASRGDFTEALAIYRRVLMAQPDNALVRERLAELFELALTEAPIITATVVVEDEPVTAAPPAELLAGLLTRIASRRRA